MKYPSVMVFVSVKNAEHIIKKCVDSILSQTYPNKKVYIIDNMSTDRTYEILKTFGKRIRLERVKGLVPKVHNHALKRIDTDFIAYTDADCIVEKNWLKKLIAGFTSDDIVATAGYCGTPEGLNRLQEIIGRELEERFKRFPEYIPRAPTMNLCVRTKIAKDVKFNEKFFWSWESDFGYRLTKRGKIRYIPEAIVYHYHRPTWRSFFKQQIKNARIKPLLYLVEHKERVFGDHISTLSMGLTLVLAYLSILLSILSLFSSFFITPTILSSGLLFFMFLRDSVKLSKKPSDFFWFFGIFVLRTVAWMIGLLIGMIGLLKCFYSNRSR